MKIVFYTRPGCSLCDSGRAVLAKVSDEWEEINVDSSPELQAAYGEFVPVIEVDGQRVAQWQVNEADLRAAISGETKRAPRRLFRRRKAR